MRKLPTGIIRITLLCLKAVSHWWEHVPYHAMTMLWSVASTIKINLTLHIEMFISKTIDI